MKNKKTLRYFCEFYDCDFYCKTTEDPPEKCPTCGRLGWIEFQTPATLKFLESQGLGDSKEVEIK